MARVTHVKKAQQRFKTVPVYDEDGSLKKTPVMKKVKDYETGEITEVQKTTKRGKPVFMTITVADKNQPLEPYTCDACRQPIEVGTPYKHITPKSGPYGGRKRTRHEGCPTWQVWEYSSSLSARLAQISHDFSQALDSVESVDDVQSALDDAAGAVEELAGEKREAADNIESGFGHSTEKSDELAQLADDLESWSSDISSADIPEIPSCEECTDGRVECDTCDGTGKVEAASVQSGEESEEVDCEDCNGEGDQECEHCDGTGEDIEAWREEVVSSVTVVDDVPF